MSNNNIHSRPTHQVGFVLKPHGFNGQLKIQLDEDFEPSDCLFIEIHNKFVPFKIKQYNANAGIINLEDINSLEKAEALCNKKILDFISDQPTSSINIIGYTMINHATQEHYAITDLLEYPNNILLECRVGFRDVLIPFHEDFIVNIDHLNKSIEMNFPNGLLDL